MKMRCGFVSNSSSSSFILSCEKDTKIKLTIEVDLAEFAELITADKERIKQFIKESYFDSYVIPLQEKIFKEIDKGKEIYICKVSTHYGDKLQSFIYDQGLKSKKIKRPRKSKIIQDIER